MWVLAPFVIATLGPLAIGRAASAAVSYDRDIRPILSNNCYKCHGPDEKQREASLRLDLRDVATKPAESGETARHAERLYDRADDRAFSPSLQPAE